MVTNVQTQKPSQSREASGITRLKPGNVVGDCKLLQFLGVGGMGEVFAAFDRSRRAQVALKLIRPELVSDREAQLRFDREVQVARQLTHPNLVATLAAGLHRGRPYLVMEHVEGTNLQALVERRGPLPVELACEYVRQAALGLHYAHEKGFVHRDVKPDNLLLASPEGVIKVADWGIALASQLSKLTKPGAVIGVPEFMAPEQLFDAGEVDRRADVFALGCVLYYLLTGRPPPRRTRLRWRSFGLPAALPEPVKADLLRMTEHDKERRFPTAAAVAERLGRGNAVPPAAPPEQAPAATQRRFIGSLVTTVRGGVSRGVTEAQQLGQRVYSMATNSKWRETTTGWLRGAGERLSRVGWGRLGACALAVGLVIALVLVLAPRAGSEPVAPAPSAPATHTVVQAPPVGQLDVSIDKKDYLVRMSALGVSPERIEVVTYPDETLERSILKITVKPAEKSTGRQVHTEIPVSDGIERRWALPLLLSRTAARVELKEGFVNIRFAIPETRTWPIGATDNSF